MNRFCFILSLGFLALNIYYIKKRRLEFIFSLPLSAVSIILLFLSLNGEFLQYLADFSGIVYAPALLFLVGITAIFLMIFYLMLVISDLKKKIKRLIQENALLDDKIEGRSV